MNDDKSPITVFFVKTLVFIFMLYIFAYLLSGSINVEKVADKAEQYIKAAIIKTKAKIW